MTDPDRSLMDRLEQEYDLRGRTLRVIIFSALLYTCFILLDWFYTPATFYTFLLIRLVVLAVHGVLYIILRRIKTNRGAEYIAITLAVVDVAGISIMIQILGGFETAYVQGLYLIIMGIVVVVPLRFRTTIILYALIWASYAIPGIFRPHGIARGKEASTNLFFLTAVVVLGVLGSYIMEVIRKREFAGRVRLEEATAKLQESNEKLKTLDQVKMQFFANVNHELRTPLTLMLAPLSPMIQERMGPVTDLQRETLDSVRHNGFRLLKLINNLLDLNKLEAGRMRLRPKTLDFDDYIESILASVKVLADQKNISLFFQHPLTKVELTIDPDQFEKVVLNLLSNALKFTPEKGRVTLYIEEREETVVLTVEDTGTGVPAHMLDAVFDRFRQVEGSAAKSGTGIGLALAKEIVSLHGGMIRVESELGQGSRFIVELLKGTKHFSEEITDRRQSDMPVAYKKRSSDGEQEGIRVQDIVANARDLQLVDLEKVDFQAAARTERRHDYQVLVIDDSPEVLKLMHLLLNDEFDLDFASSGEEGLRILRERAPDLVLSDVMMPGMDGHELCRRIKAEENIKHTPVLLVTARSASEMLAAGMESGADDYIIKPFNAVELKARIRSHLRMRQVEAELALANRNLKMRTSDLVDRQRTLFISMVKSLVSALEAKDFYTRHHSARVTDFSLKIARHMGFGERELDDLELAALLHDVGKIGIPENILNKPGPLTSEEYKAIMDHPVFGEGILKPVVELTQIAKVVRYHHEKYDGSGYPDGLKGLEIPLGARIMTVADAYDAITSKRPYRGEESHHYAVKEIIRCSGAQFDPEVIQHFMEVAKTFSVQNGGGSA
jgi:response regulator RpfG family c-di-GMP phosphodiesterase/signal transduction histidine kinase